MTIRDMLTIILLGTALGAGMAYGLDRQLQIEQGAQL